MSRFLKPTIVTWIFLIAPFIFISIPFIFHVKLPGLIEYIFIWFFFFPAGLLFKFYKLLGLNIGRYTEYYGYPDPNIFGAILIITSYLIFLYLVACSISFIWYRILGIIRKK